MIGLSSHRFHMMEGDTMDISCILSDALPEVFFNSQLFVAAGAALFGITVFYRLK